MIEFYFFCLYFFVYGFLGWYSEVAFAAWKEHCFVNRGFLNGPICPIYGIGVSSVVWLLSPYKENLLLLYITSIVLVTALEWLTGFILEKVFHNKWWDYSDLPLNLNGYVCLPFSLMWGVACVLIVDFIHPVFQTMLAYIPFPLGVALLVLLGTTMLIDLIVTASGILKFNKNLEKMQEIADELHQISDQLGENIYTGTILAMEKPAEIKVSIAEKQDDLSETLSNVSDEVKERITVLRSHYKESLGNITGLQKRIIRAFPRMQSIPHKEILNDLRKKLKELDSSFRGN